MPVNVKVIGYGKNIPTGKEHDAYNIQVKTNDLKKHNLTIDRRITDTTKLYISMEDLDTSRFYDIQIAPEVLFEVIKSLSENGAGL